ncbi:hypothetical protein PENTCL1PPCAC_18770, partial [Pristionchus entomophagus]
LATTRPMTPLSSSLILLLLAVSPSLSARTTNGTLLAHASATVQETRLCSCKEANACRRESSQQLNSCLEECSGRIESYGDNTDSYLGCFKQNSASIVEAENCLFDGLRGTYCSAHAWTATNFTDEADWDKLTEFTYSSQADQSIKGTVLWKRDEEKYNKIQNFFHCSKHCMHRRFHECTSTKGCGVRMPTLEKFEQKMRTCTKKNWKIGQSIFMTCQCLAWKNQVKELQGGACAIIGTSYYIDRA